jgi:hypothetical protein
MRGFPKRKGRPSRPVDDQHSERQQAFDRFSAAVAMPMLVLTIVMIPVLIAPIVMHHLDPAVDSALVTADYLIWGIFLLEYLIRLALHRDASISSSTTSRTWSW